MYNKLYDSPTLHVLVTEEFSKWLRRLGDERAKALINLRIRRVSLSGNLGDFKAIGGGILELRVDYGPGYRLYCSKRGLRLILLLIGGSKGTQKRDIQKARDLNSEYEVGSDENEASTTV